MNSFAQFLFQTDVRQECAKMLTHFMEGAAKIFETDDCLPVRQNLLTEAAAGVSNSGNRAAEHQIKLLFTLYTLLSSPHPYHYHEATFKVQRELMTF